MINTIIFDLDGVLVDAKRIHYDTLNEALCEVDEKYFITEEEHLTIFDGLKTKEKLDLLTKIRGLNVSDHDRIWLNKQKYTINKLNYLTEDEVIIHTIKNLKNLGYKIVCCSNSIRESILVMLTRIGVIDYFDLIISNEEVEKSKPYPEMYWKAMNSLKVTPEDVLIVEDSPNGLLAANRATKNVYRVKNSSEVTYLNIIEQLSKFNKLNNKPKWVDKNLNILVPMAGLGSRFSQAGYVNPKPLISVNGTPMIKVVVDNINIDANYIFVVQKQHREKYNLDVILDLIAPNCKIVEVDGLTEGAACTTLAAKDEINSNKPLLIVNSDQFIEWDSNDFMYKMNESKVDGGILTFKANETKWSYVKCDSNGFVKELAEKKVISDDATTGIYYWSNGSEYVKYAEQMIDKNIRVNNEFYVAPVYNEAIIDDKKIKKYEVSEMWGIGTPEDLNHFLKNKL